MGLRRVSRGTHPAARPGRVSRRPQAVRVCRNPASPGSMPVDGCRRQPMNAATNAIATTAPITPISVSSRAPAAPFANAPIRNRKAAAMSHLSARRKPLRRLSQQEFLRLLLRTSELLYVETDTSIRHPGWNTPSRRPIHCMPRPDVFRRHPPCYAVEEHGSNETVS